MKLSQFALKILRGHENLTSIEGDNSVMNLLKMTGNNRNLDLVNINKHAEFGKILSISSQVVERKPKSDINQWP